MLPDADLLLLSIVKAAEPTFKIGTQIPADLLKKVDAGTPFATIRRFGGSAVNVEFYDRASIDVQTWAKTRKASYDMSAAIRAAFLDAWLSQTTYPLGHVGRFSETTGINELRTADQADRVWRFQATYSMFLRPAPAI